jgi:hypothetical protein
MCRLATSGPSLWYTPLISLLEGLQMLASRAWRRGSANSPPNIHRYVSYINVYMYNMNFWWGTYACARTRTQTNNRRVGEHADDHTNVSLHVHIGARMHVYTDICIQVYKSTSKHIGRQTRGLKWVCMNWFCEHMPLWWPLTAYMHTYAQTKQWICRRTNWWTHKHPSWSKWWTPRVSLTANPKKSPSRSRHHHLIGLLQLCRRPPSPPSWCRGILRTQTRPLQN